MKSQQGLPLASHSKLESCLSINSTPCSSICSKPASNSNSTTLKPSSCLSGSSWIETAVECVTSSPSLPRKDLMGTSTFSCITYRRHYKIVQVSWQIPMCCHSRKRSPWFSIWDASLISYFRAKKQQVQPLKRSILSNWDSSKQMLIAKCKNWRKMKSLQRWFPRWSSKIPLTAPISHKYIMWSRERTNYSSPRIIIILSLRWISRKYNWLISITTIRLRGKSSSGPAASQWKMKRLMWGLRKKGGSPWRMWREGTRIRIGLFCLKSLPSIKDTTVGILSPPSPPCWRATETCASKTYPDESFLLHFYFYNGLCIIFFLLI